MEKFSFDIENEQAGVFAATLVGMIEPSIYDENETRRLAGLIVHCWLETGHRKANLIFSKGGRQTLTEAEANALLILMRWYEWPSLYWLSNIYTKLDLFITNTQGMRQVDSQRRRMENIKQ